MSELKLAPALVYYEDGGSIGVMSQKTVISVL
jgi:hypothetical protein